MQGHRGARGLYPENTINGFLYALDLGVNTLEMDVVISGDGEVVLSHEATLNPEICLDPNGNRIPKDQVFNLFQMDYDSIARCDCGSNGNPRFPEQKQVNEKKPRLVDVITAVKERCAETGKQIPHFNVEIKASPKYVYLFHPTIKEFADAVISVLQKNLPLDSYNIQSFDGMTLQYVHQVYPQIQLSYLQEGLGFKSVEELDADLVDLGFVPEVYSCQYTMLTQEVVNHLQAKNVQVIPWTVNEMDDMNSLINMGVDGIITDYPNRLLNLIGRLEK